MIGLRVRFSKQRHLQKYDHLQPPDAADFAMVDLIIIVSHILIQKVHTLF